FAYFDAGTLCDFSAQKKFSAWSMLPVPLYCASCGYGQSGRLRSTLPAVECVARIERGGVPCSRQCSSGVSASKTLGPSPPPQCPMPGAKNRRTDSSTCFGPIVLTTLL